MTEEDFRFPQEPWHFKDWRSELERAGWCRCGKREDEPSPGCAWHEARAEKEATND